MDDDHNVLLTLFLVFAPLSLSALGGGVSIISAIQHQAVDVHHWVTASEFLSLFAISRGAPGPGSMMLTTLIGWQVAGLAGALVATFAMFVPSSIICIAVGAVWQKLRGRPFVTLLELALAPIGAGLLVGGVASLTELVSANPSLLLIAIAASAASVVIPVVHPLALIALGAAINVTIAAMFGP